MKMLCELPPVLQWDCIESGLLKVPLNLQALAWKHTVAEPKKAARLALKKLQKNLSKKARKVLAASWRKHLQDKLKGQSLSQAVAAVVPVAGGGKPAKGKNSVKIGEGKAVKKQKLKSKQKMADAKAVKKLLGKSEESKAEAVAEKPAPEQPEESDPVLAKAAKKEQGILFGKAVKLFKEGSNCGCSGTATAHNSVLGTVQISCLGPALATVVVKADEVAEVDPAWKKPLKLKNMKLGQAADYSETLWISAEVSSGRWFWC